MLRAVTHVLRGQLAAGPSGSVQWRCMASAGDVKDAASRAAEKVHGATERARAGVDSAADSASAKADEMRGRAAEGSATASGTWDSMKEAAVHGAERVKERVHDAWEGAKQAVNVNAAVGAEVLGATKESVKDMAHDASEQAKAAYQSVKEAATSRVADAAGSMAETGGTTARTTTTATDIPPQGTDLPPQPDSFGVDSKGKPISEAIDEHQRAHTNKP